MRIEKGKNGAENSRVSLGKILIYVKDCGRQKAPYLARTGLQSGPCSGVKDDQIHVVM